MDKISRPSDTFQGLEAYTLCAMLAQCPQWKIHRSAVYSIFKYYYREAVGYSDTTVLFHIDGPEVLKKQGHRLEDTIHENS